ncbi:thermonuclease family protein [Chelatococcus sp. XZ-Ab1]|uniref:thermonuclease family protein n=1 Tax=Chelatococcus sp. XZ-Ab1 TaxID=3034027 RepID=UPI0023E410A0|nr:thermonuclease family protein [Chelatococcus sp. XZ-Ab1]
MKRYKRWMRYPAPIPLLAFAAGIGTAALVGQGVERSEIPAAVSVRGVAQRGTFAAEVLRVVDGDTIEARVAVWPGHEIRTKVRIAGLDAPERAGRCREERRAAQAAHEALARLVRDGGIVLSQVQPDKYFGRVVARVFDAKDQDVGALLREAGHARAYAGGRRDSWCNGQAQHRDAPVTPMRQG